MQPETTRIQLCGKLVVEVQGRPLADALPGRQGRALFAYLVINRRRNVTRDELIEAIWPNATAAAESNLRPVVSRLRRVLGDALRGRGSLQLVLPSDAWIDLEAVDAAIHRAESAVERAQWSEAWAPSHIALNISRRVLLPELEAPWIDQLRRHLDEVRLRALECWIRAGLGIGGPELADAEAAARTLTREAPLRETGHVLLMGVLDARGKAAEAVAAYEQLRMRLDEELGIAPGPAARELHTRILRRKGGRPGETTR